MAENGKAISPKQEKALAALMAKPTIEAAADAAGVSYRTLRYWLADPRFADAYRAARREAMQQAIARLQNASSAAVGVLLRLMAEKDTPPHVRLGAASKVLDTAIKAVELEDLAARLEALERAYATIGHP